MDILVQNITGFLIEIGSLTLTMLWPKSADDKQMIFFLESRIWHFMHIVSYHGDNLHEVSDPTF